MLLQLVTLGLGLRGLRLPAMLNLEPVSATLRDPLIVVTIDKLEHATLQSIDVPRDEPTANGTTKLEIQIQSAVTELIPRTLEVVRALGLGLLLRPRSRLPRIYPVLATEEKLNAIANSLESLIVIRPPTVASSHYIASISAIIIV